MSCVRSLRNFLDDSERPAKMDGINPKAKLIDNEVITDYPSPSEHEIRKNVVSSLVGDGGNLKRTTLSWKGIDVFASIGRGSICKRLCSKGSTDEPKIKQLLFDGKYL